MDTNNNAFTFNCSIPADVLNHRLDVLFGFVTLAFNTFAPLAVKAIGDEQVRNAERHAAFMREQEHLANVRKLEATRAELEIGQMRAEIEKLRGGK